MTKLADLRKLCLEGNLPEATKLLSVLQSKYHGSSYLLGCLSEIQTKYSLTPKAAQSDFQIRSEKVIWLNNIEPYILPISGRYAVYERSLRIERCDHAWGVIRIPVFIPKSASLRLHSSNYPDNIQVRLLNIQNKQVYTSEFGSFEKNKFCQCILISAFLLELRVNAKYAILVYAFGHLFEHSA